MATEKHEKILQAANHLAELLQASPEYVHYISAKRRLLQDPSNKRIFTELREKQFDLQEAMDGEGELNGELGEKDKFINDLLVSVSLNPVVNDYLNAEYNFGRILERLGEVFESIFPYDDMEDDEDEDIMSLLEHTDKQALSEVRYLN